VGGHDDQASVVGDLAQQAQDPVNLDVVQVGGGLVGQDEGRVVGQGAGDGDSLLLATGEIPGFSIQWGCCRGSCCAADVADAGEPRAVRVEQAVRGDLAVAAKLVTRRGSCR